MMRLPRVIFGAVVILVATATLCFVLLTRRTTAENLIIVMAALDATIHGPRICRWMAGSSPAMTGEI
jgi:hypothetical protein